MIENKEHLKKIEKRSLTNQIFNSWLQEIWLKFFELMHSLHMPDHKPNHARHKAAQKDQEQTWKNLQKSQNCKHLYKAIQSTRFVSIASSRSPDHIPIRIIHQNAKNW